MNKNQLNDEYVKKYIKCAYFKRIISINMKNYIIEKNK
jgi:hypothetical protein